MVIRLFSNISLEQMQFAYSLGFDKQISNCTVYIQKQVVCKLLCVFGALLVWLIYVPWTHVPNYYNEVGLDQLWYSVVAVVLFRAAMKNYNAFGNIFQWLAIG